MPAGDGNFYLYLHGDVRKASGTAVGDRVRAKLFGRDDRNGPQHPMPRWFKQALAGNLEARKNWTALIPSRKKEILRYFARLNSRDARAQNLAKALHGLSGRTGRFMARAWKNASRPSPGSACNIRRARSEGTQALATIRQSVPVQLVGATPSELKALIKGGVYDRRKRTPLSATQRVEVWRRWKAGESLHAIGRAVGKDHVVVHLLLKRHGGIARAYVAVPRRHSPWQNAKTSPVESLAAARCGPSHKVCVAPAPRSAERWPAMAAARSIVPTKPISRPGSRPCAPSSASWPGMTSSGRWLRVN